MKAIRIREYGDASRLKLEDTPQLTVEHDCSAGRRLQVFSPELRPSVVPNSYHFYSLRPITAVMFTILTAVGCGMVRDVVVSKLPTTDRQALRRRYTVAQFSPEAMHRGT